MNTAMRSPLRVFSGRTEALMPPPVLARRVERGKEPGTAGCRRQRRRRGVLRRERIKGARFHEAFEYALVREPQIEVLAEGVERRDPPLRRADGQERFNRA